MDQAVGAQRLWAQVAACTPRGRAILAGRGVRFDANGDSCLSIFADVYATGALDFPAGAAVLEIGCAEADWRTPMLALRPDLHLTGIDWRGTGGAGTVIKGDVLTYDFPPASFDVIVGISSIEHIGLGHYESDPLAVDGDVRCMTRAAGWLKPGGWIYADVPYGAFYTVYDSSHRQYDDAALLERLVPPGLTVERRWFSYGAGLVDGAALDPNRFQYVALLLRKDS